MRVQPYFSAASNVAPKAERVPRNATGISFSRWKSRRRNIVMSVATRLKVLVSCMNRAVRTRGTGHLRERFSGVIALGDQRGNSCLHRHGFGLYDSIHRRRGLPLPWRQDLLRPAVGKRQMQRLVEIVQGSTLRVPGEDPAARLCVGRETCLGEGLDVLVDHRCRYTELF